LGLEEAMAIIKRTRLETLNEVLLIIDKIVQAPVKRDGKPPKHIQIRDAVRDLVLKP
jgi:hypothetical protein